MCQSNDGLLVFTEADVLVGRMVEVAIARPVSDHGAVPDGADHVHVAGARFQNKGGAFPLRPNGL